MQERTILAIIFDKPLVIQVRYEDPRYSVMEAEGSVELCVTTMSPVNRPFVVRATTLPGSDDNSASMFTYVYYILTCIIHLRYKLLY